MYHGRLAQPEAFQPIYIVHVIAHERTHGHLYNSYWVHWIKNNFVGTITFENIFLLSDIVFEMMKCFETNLQTYNLNSLLSTETVLQCHLFIERAFIHLKVGFGEFQNLQIFFFANIYCLRMQTLSRLLTLPSSSNYVEFCLSQLDLRMIVREHIVREKTFWKIKIW